jgi:hypothetical protein
VSKRYKHKDLLSILKHYGITEIESRGKGSERMLYQESTRLNYPIKYHGKKTEHGDGIISAIKRKFNLPNDFDKIS